MNNHDPKLIPLRPHPPDGEQERRPVIALVLRRLFEYREQGVIVDPWLEFPQNGCCFNFQRKYANDQTPLPVGALELLWTAGSPYCQPCPECGCMAYTTEFGGLLSTGGLWLVCVGCTREWCQPLGGLGRVMKLLHSSPLMGTPFQPASSLFGGVYRSEGKPLCRLLGIDAEPEEGGGASFVLHLDGGDRALTLGVGYEIKHPGNSH